MSRVIAKRFEFNFKQEELELWEKIEEYANKEKITNTKAIKELLEFAFEIKKHGIQIIDGKPKQVQIFDIGVNQ